MAKGQKRSNREIKKPKKPKAEPPKPGSSLPLTQPGGPARKGSTKR
jgi:hypothetical protein